MAIETPVDLKRMLIDKKALQARVAELDARMGVVIDPNATAEKAQAMTRALGIRPEDCEFSRELIRMRYPEGDV